MEIDIYALKPSKYSLDIYSSDPDEGLIESIKRNGVLQPIWIDNNNVIISGHRRVNACKELGIETIEYEYREYSDSLVIESNRYREKTWKEKLKEVAELERILKPRAKHNQGERKDILPNLAESNDVDTREEVAKALNTSHGTLDKIKEIQEKKPELLEEIDQGTKSIHGAYLQIKRDEPRPKQPDMPTNTYRVIYADPPWEYGNKGLGQYGHAEQHYSTMSISQLCELPLYKIIDDNAVLFLWVTSPLLEDSFKVIKAWGFKYKTSFVWDKIKHNFGHYNSVRHELLLISTKGSCLPDTNKLHDSVISLERSNKHSEKPEYFRGLIESMYDGKKIELFARNKNEGWDTWGNEL